MRPSTGVSAAGDERRGLTLISGGLAPKIYDHEPQPKLDTMYSIEGPNAGRPADLRRAWDYPVSAFCLHCGEMIELGQLLPIGDRGEWQHTGRLPGQPG
jgi:hypothetical protein